MRVLYFLKWPIIIFLAGFLVRFTGVLFKIRHWPSADDMIMIGSVIGGFAIIFGLIKIAFMKKPAG